ncbi:MULTISPECIES: Rho termination factor N-terminal domain-containing protein [Microbacterium]|uniref:Rho termination factor N-terminal domain-containing protein n=1 Tax=Microbacterium TaxID=33882 RepID=UPI001C2BFA52|nr:Rho termination factor N-terminal domain-containing protein [Microbacterium paraoxydans]QXE28942.1 Rho termination factor N-terminal domain-containing protein [Microbacterium paraoxydans]
MRIIHPRPQLGRQRDLGVEFRDGVATVESLHPERELALRQHGYTIEADPEVAAPFQEALGEPIIDLTSLTVPQLRDIAEVEGIELPAKARKDEIVEILASTSAPIPGATRNDDGSWTIEGPPVDEADIANGPFGTATTVDGTVIGDGKTIATLPVFEG